MMGIRCIMVGAALVGATPCYGDEVSAGEEVISIEEFEVPSVLFACPGPGLRSLGIRYGNEERYLNFINMTDDISFHSNDAIKSVRFKEYPDGRTWHISANGPALGEKGPLGYDFQIELTIRERTDGGLAADWNVRAGDYVGQETDCRPLRIPRALSQDSK